VNVEDPQVIQNAITQLDGVVQARLQEAASDLGKVVADALAGLQTLARGLALNLQATADSTVLNTQNLQKTIAALDGWTAEIRLTGQLAPLLGTIQIRLSKPKG
jgi:hypothetical protein